MQFWHFCWKYFGEIPQNFCWMSKILKVVEFFQKYFHKCSFQHVECSFNITVDTFWLKICKKVLKSGNFPMKNSAANCSSGDVKCSFDNAADRTSTKVWRFFNKVPERIRLEFFRYKFSPWFSSGPKEHCFENSWEGYAMKIRKLSHQSPKKPSKIWTLSVLSKNLRLDTLNAVWQPCRKVLA